MITTIIFDFGDIFINLEKEKVSKALAAIGLQTENLLVSTLNHQYEVGAINEIDFLLGLQKQIPNVPLNAIKDTWNTILGTFPEYRLEFLEHLAAKYPLFLLSNTDFTHIEAFKKKVGNHFYNRFVSCFEKVYYSFEMGMRKPDTAIYKFLIDAHQLNPVQTLFVDDKEENTNAAKKTGLRVWNLQVGKEDVIDIETIIKQLT